MIECPVYWLNSENLVGDFSEPPAEPTTCVDGCSCGYLQFEQLLPYLDEIKRITGWDTEKATELEMMLRGQILEVSRLFDRQANVKAGYFSKSHFQTTKVFPTNGTRYIKIPEFVLGTLEVRTNNNQVLSPGSYGFQNGFLTYLPCVKHTHCGCSWSCHQPKSIKPLRWPNACYKITAKWGRDCADPAVQMAVREYLIENYRVQDPVVMQATGIPVNRSFRVPHAWSSYIASFKGERDLFQKFAIA